MVGLAKNAGKTTTLNALVAHASGAGMRVAICSIGRDGEREDILTRLPKPAITVPAGSYCVTTDRLAVGLELIEPLDQAGVLGRPGVYRCPASFGANGCTVELVGMNRITVARSALTVLDRLADVVFIDGAFDRRSAAVPALCDGVVLATGAAVGNTPDLVAHRTAHVVRLIHLPVCTDDPDDVPTVVVPGALTARRFRSYAEDLAMREAGRLRVRDWTRVFLDERELSDLSASGWSICVETGARLLAVTTNPFNPDGPRADATALRDAVRHRLVTDGYDVPCVDIKVECRGGEGSTDAQS